MVAPCRITWNRNSHMANNLIRSRSPDLDQESTLNVGLHYGFATEILSYLQI